MAHSSITKKGGTVELKSVADLVGDLVHPAVIAATSTSLATVKTLPPKALSPISTNSMGQPFAMTEADRFWTTLKARIVECDRLIHRVCDLRGDSDEYRAEMLAIRRRIAPAKLDSDIAYLKAVLKRCEQLIEANKP